MKFILGDFAHSAYERNLYLKKKNITFTEHKIDGDDNARELMMERANGKRTVPQIFINDKSIGGCDELYELEKEDKLDLLLN